MLPAIPTHNAIGGIWRVNNGEIEVLVVDVARRDPTTGRVVGKVATKFPGGGSRPQEPLIVTLQREILEETYLAFLPSSAREIWRNERKGEHTRYGFIIAYDECRGELRKTTFIEDGDEVSEPRFVKVRALGSRICPSHFDFYEHLCQELGVVTQSREMLP